MTLRGKELADAERWLQEGVGKDPRPTQLQAQFIGESRRRVNFRQRTTIGGLSVGSIVILILLVIALSLNGVVSAQNTTLTSQNINLSAESIAGEARATLPSNRIDQALLLSLVALQRKNEFETRDTLLSSLEYSPYLDTILQDGSSNADGQHIAVAFCQDQSTLMQATNSRVILWDVMQRKELRQLEEGKGDIIIAAALSPDCKTVATKDGTGVTLWDAAAGVRLSHLPAINTGNTLSFHNFAFSPDSRYLASADCVDQACQKGQITLWNLATTTIATRLPTDFRPGDLSLAFSPDGKLLAMTECDSPIGLCGNSQFVVWNLSSSTRIFSFQASLGPSPGPLGNGSFATLAFSPDGRYVALGGCEDAVCKAGLMTQWDVATKSFIAEQAVAGGEVNDLAFSPDQLTLMVINGHLETSRLQAFDALTGAFSDLPFLGHSAVITSIAFSPDGKYFATTGFDNKLLLWHRAPRTSFSLPTGMGLDGASYAVFSHDGKELATAGSLTPDGSVTGIALWDMETGSIVSRIAGPFDVLSLALSPDGKMIASGEGNGRLSLWDVASHQPIGILIPSSPGPGAFFVRTLAFSPDSRYLVSTGFSDSNTARTILWDIAQERPIHEFSAKCACGAAFSPDGQMLAITDGSPNIILWDVFNNVSIAQLPNPAGAIDVAISPDGKVLAALDINGNISLWNIQQHQRFGHLLANQSSFTLLNTSLAFSPDGRLLVSTTGRSMTLWDWANGEPFVRPLQDQSDILKAEFSPDGQFLVSSDNLGPVVVRYATLAGWKAQACQIAHRDLTAEEWKQFIPGGIPYHRVCDDSAITAAFTA